MRLTDSDAAIGLGGIAKGYSVDRAAEILIAKGHRKFYIDGGGDIRVVGAKGKAPWRVGVRHPRMNRKTLSRLSRYPTVQSIFLETTNTIV